MPKTSKRPCCQLLRQCIQQLDKLKTSEGVAQVLEVLSRECLLLRTVGKAEIGYDAVNLNCFLHVSPNADDLTSEIGKTVAANLELQQKYYLLLAAINEILSKNAHTQQISAYLLSLLAEVRQGERKFGAVLAETKTLLDTQGNTPENAYMPAAHPLLMKTQMMDGISDHNAAAVPSDNPQAQQKAEELKLQPRPDIKYQPKSQPVSAPTYKPPGTS